MNKLIYEYEDVFATNPKKPKRTHLMQHQIIRGDALPVKSIGKGS